MSEHYHNNQDASHEEYQYRFPEVFASKKPVVMQIIPELGAGGAEQGCIDVSNAIIAAGGRSIIVSNGGMRVYEAMKKGAEHITLPVHSKNPLTMWRNAQRLKNIIYKERVNIVHARSRAPAWSAYKACKETNTPFVTTCHAAYKFEGKLKRKYNSVMASGDRVISISGFITDYLKDSYNISDDKIRLAYRGLPMEKYKPNAVTKERLITLAKEWRLPDGALVVMMPARLTRIKGHHFLIDAIAKLKRKDVVCVFLGSDQGRKAYRHELEDTIKEKGLEGRVRIVPHCNDMPTAYMLASVTVCASIVPEGFGRVPVESQAMGRPTIATNHGGAAETIVPDFTGWLVEPGNVDEMANAINEALNLTNEERENLAYASMMHVAQYFSVEAMCANVLETYSELL
ncbi:MAG: glycosyl transferase [Rickettsiales bacterium]|nr:glycosyl transferase [Rickettsiales bacterium]